MDLLPGERPTPLPPREDDEDLGGRLRLLDPASLDPAQRELHRQVSDTRVIAASRAGYAAALPDGRLIGPFNALLRAPKIAQAYLRWAATLSADGPGPGGVEPPVREAAVLVVAAHWGSTYVRYAHRAAAAAAGLDAGTVQALAAGDEPRSAAEPVRVAARLATALVDDHDVPDDLYARARAVFTEQQLVQLVSVIGQYTTTAALLACFRVPAPHS